jgi:hypothetical protein
VYTIPNNMVTPWDTMPTCHNTIEVLPGRRLRRAVSKCPRDCIETHAAGRF